MRHVDSYDVSLLIGESLTLGASFPTHVSSLPAPSLSKRKLFAIFSPYGPIYFVARAPNLLDVSALAARKHTRRRFIFGGAASENLRATAPASLR